MRGATVSLILLVFVILPTTFGQLQITEVMYNPAGSDTGNEWIEVYNNANSTVSIEGWRFLENNQNHHLSLYQGSYEVLPYNFIIIARSGDGFLSKYPTYAGSIVESVFTLLNSNGEEIGIVDNNLKQIDVTTYDTVALEGHSVIRDVDIDTWISEIENGSPGSISKRPNDVPEFGTISIIFLCLMLLGTQILRKK